MAERFYARPAAALVPPTKAASSLLLFSLKHFSTPGGIRCTFPIPAVPTEPVGWADTSPPTEADNRSLVLFDRGDEVTVQAGDDGIRFLLVSGKPLEEPVAWYGPIVMNTQEELRQAFKELEQGTFLKRQTPR